MDDSSWYILVYTADTEIPGCVTLKQLREVNWLPWGAISAQVVVSIQRPPASSSHVSRLPLRRA